MWKHATHKTTFRGKTRQSLIVTEGSAYGNHHALNQWCATYGNSLLQTCHLQLFPYWNVTHFIHWKVNNRHKGINLTKRNLPSPTLLMTYYSCLTRIISDCILSNLIDIHNCYLQLHYITGRHSLCLLFYFSAYRVCYISIWKMVVTRL